MNGKILLAWLATSCAACADPQLTSWITEHSGSYARVYESEADQRAGRASTTWGNFRLQQSLPAYCGVQEISYSADWIYIRTTGLGSHVMGPWFDNAARSRPFINVPLNQKRIFRLPRVPIVRGEKSPVRGDIGLFVDGVHAFDASDATSYSTELQRDGDPPGRPDGVRGDRVWNRDAFVNEAVTFDPAMAHQQNTGDYHYHANPVAPRYLLHDHVELDPATGIYRESETAPERHSPIVGWARDGFPIYGPYGYSRSIDPSSGVRRMICGYVRRDGQNGTEDLARFGRHSLPAWVARAHGIAASLSPAQYGPDVSARFPLGRYLEDNDFLGDLGKQQGVDFDLDEYNGRYGVTPEYPGGTYAYFVSIAADGTPLFPYNLGQRYQGVPSGGIVREIEEPVTIVFSGGPAQQEQILSATPKDGEVALVWSSVEGGTYRIEAKASADRAAETLAQAVPAQGSVTKANVVGSETAPESAKRKYTVTRTALAPYDTVERPPRSSGILSVSPIHARPGESFRLAIHLDEAAFPPPPRAPVMRASIGSVMGGEWRHLSRTEVTVEFTLPADAKAGTQPISITFPGPPNRPEDISTFTLLQGFEIDAPATGASTLTQK